MKYNDTTGYNKISTYFGNQTSTLHIKEIKKVVLEKNDRNVAYDLNCLDFKFLF